MSFVTDPSTLCTAAEGLQQTTGSTLKDILNTKAVCQLMWSLNIEKIYK